MLLTAQRKESLRFLMVPTHSDRHRPDPGKPAERGRRPAARRPPPRAELPARERGPQPAAAIPQATASFHRLRGARLAPGTPIYLELDLFVELIKNSFSCNSKIVLLS